MLSDCLPLSSYAMSIHYEVYCRDMHTEGSRKLFSGGTTAELCTVKVYNVTKRLSFHR